MFCTEAAYYAHIQEVLGPDGSQFIATFPDISEISAQAPSLFEVIEEAREKLSAHVLPLVESGQPLPHPHNHHDESTHHLIQVMWWS